MKRLLTVLCVVLSLAACLPEKEQARFDVLPNEISFWSERQGSLTIQLNGAASVRLDNLIRKHKNETIDYYIGDTLVESSMARAPVDTGSLIFTMEDKTRIKVEPLLPSAMRRD